nr:hypothetical protein CFP56_04548 [Quercus suber]
MPPRANKPADLTFNQRASDETSGPQTSPIGVDLSTFSGPGEPNDVGIAQLPPLPQSPPTSPSLSRDQSKGFLSNLKHRISPEQEQRPQIHLKHEDDEAYRPGSSSMAKLYHLKKNPGSTPELSLVRSAESGAKQPSEGEIPRNYQCSCFTLRACDSTSASFARENGGWSLELEVA